MSQVCLSKQDTILYIFLLICIISFLSYNLSCKCKEQMSNINLNSHLSNENLQQKLKKLQDDLYNSQMSEQKCSFELDKTKKLLNEFQSNRVLNKIYNPVVAPERIYPGGKMNVPSYDDYQLIGFVYNSTQRYPLFGRYKYPGRSDRWEYYIIDESRNRLKMPFKSKNDNELYGGDTVTIPTLPGTFQTEIYEYETFRYNPNLV